jgi:hypothetical protein
MPWTLWGSVCALSLLLIALTIAFHLITRYDWYFGGTFQPWRMQTVEALGTLGAPILGAVIVWRQPTNRYGWVWCLLGLAAAVRGAAFAYELWAWFVAPVQPGGFEAAWLGNVTYILYLGLVPLTLLLFPDGKPPSPRWRPVVWATVVVAVVWTLATAVAPGLIIDDSPNLIVSLYGTPAELATWLVIKLEWAVRLLIAVGGLSLLARLRHARGRQRQQVKWLTYVGVLIAAALVVQLKWYPTGLVQATYLAVVAWAVYLAIGIAVLRHRLYDIDRLITRTLVYGLLTALATTVYLTIVVGIGTLAGSRGKPNLFLTIVATAVIAVVFQPARDRSRRLANRLVYGKRATPYEVLSAFSQAMAGASTDDSLLRMARLVVEATGAVQATVWLRLGDLLQSAGLLAPGRASARAHRARRARRPGGPGHDTAQEQEVSGRIRGRPARGAHGNGLPPRAPHPRRREADRRPGRPDRTGPSLPAHEGARPVRQGARLLPPTGGRRAGRGVTLGAVAAGGAGGHHLVLRHPRLLLPGRAAPAAGGGRGGWAPPCRHG